MSDFSAAKLNSLQLKICGARNADEIVALSPGLRKEWGDEAFAGAVASYARSFSPLLLRQVMEAAKKPEVLTTLVANPHCGRAMISWLLGHQARSAIRWNRPLAYSTLNILEVAARREGLGVPIPTLELLYQGVELPKEHNNDAGATLRLREAVDVLYGECLKGAPAEQQGRALLAHGGAWAFDNEDRGGQAVAEHPYTSTQMILKMYHEHPTKTLLMAVLRSAEVKRKELPGTAHIFEPEVRALYWERIEGQHGGEAEREWASWLLMAASREDFARAWDVAGETPGLLERLISQDLFPQEALGWLDAARRARILVSDRAEVRLKVICAAGEPERPLRAPTEIAAPIARSVASR